MLQKCSCCNNCSLRPAFSPSIARTTPPPPVPSASVCICQFNAVAFNRYTPGLQRLGSSVWTGDVSVSWAAMQQQPAYLLNWQLAGAGYVTCDIGGFTGGNDPADLLVRW